MTNKQKLKQIVTNLKEMRHKKFLEGLKNEVNGTKAQMEYIRKIMVVTELEFLEKKPYITFYNDIHGYYTQPICNRKKRIWAVPLCFLITLYEEDLKMILPEKKIQIPYTLRGFWKMEKAVEMLEEFIRLQNECQNTLLWETRRLSKISKKKEKAYSKILDEFVAMRISYNGWKTEICYNDLQFRLNKKNVKLDVVPLCKLLTIYYVRVVSQMEHYAKTYANRQEKEKLKAIKSDFSKFMEKYFTVKTIC